MSWTIKTFGDCAEYIRNVVQPNDIGSAPYIGLEHISQGQLSLLAFGSSQDVVSAKLRFQKGDILFGKLRPYFRKVIIAPFCGVCSTDFWVVRAKPGTNQRFLFYWMASKEFIDDSTRAAEGTKMPRAQWEYVEKIQKYIPQENEQLVIAEVLGRLDDKIEINRRMNKTLEVLAKEIYEYCFTKNEDKYLWDTGKFIDIISLYRDTVSPQKFPEESFFHYSIPAFDNGCFPKKEPGRAIMSNKYLVNKKSVLISRLNPEIIRIWLPHENNKYRSICSTEFIVMIPKNTITQEFLVGFLHSNEFYDKFSSMVTGTSGSHQRVKPEYLYNMKVIIPSKYWIDYYTNLVQPILNKIKQNILEIRTLAVLRDTLLPKLISGEVRVE